MASDEAPILSARHAILRADASAALGSGHFARTRTLGEALMRRGWRVTFVTRDLPGRIASAIEHVGMAVVSLRSGPGSEAREIADRVGDDVDLVAADHYGLGAAWFESIRQDAPDALLMVIDDLGDRHLPVDLVLNQNLGADAQMYAGSIPIGTVVLAGPAFALLRPEFAAVRARARTRDGHVDRVLVFVSGSDAPDVTARAMIGLGDLGLTIDVVVGGAHPDLDGLRSIAARQPATRLFVDIDGMAEVMDRADLAVGAPGSASWERCAVGLPAVVVILAENQVSNAHHLVDAGAATSLGWHTAVSSQAIAEAVGDLMSDPRRVAAMSRAAAAVTDGRGTDRVIAEIDAIRSRLRGDG